MNNETRTNRKTGTNKERKKRMIRNAALVCSLAAVLSVGSVSAYFTDRETAVNTFTVGSVELTLTEPHWKTDDLNDNGIPDAAENIVPDQELAKDPIITNTGINPEYVFMEVTVPTALIQTAQENGTANGSAETQLFSYAVNSGWTPVSGYGTSTSGIRNATGTSGVHTAASAAVPATDSAPEAAGTNGSVTYLYAYTGADSASMEVLEAEAATPALFNAVKLANILEDERLAASADRQEGRDLEISVCAYGIQASFINNGDSSIDGENGNGQTAPADVWTVLSNRNTAAPAS